MRKSARRFSYATREIRDALLDALASATAGVGDQVLRPDGGGALELAAEGENGFRANDRVGRGHVDQVVVMDDKRVKIVLLADVCKQLAIERQGRTGAPH